MTEDEDTVLLFRSTGPAEYRQLEENGFTRWPPRLPDQPIFYPVLHESYAEEVARRWNVPEDSVAYVTRFRVKKSFMDQYEFHKVGGELHIEYWIPAEDLEALNENIVGKIEVIGEYRTTGEEKPT